jgi:hypothetical protein
MLSSVYSILLTLKIKHVCALNLLGVRKEMKGIKEMRGSVHVKRLPGKRPAAGGGSSGKLFL